MSYLPRIFWGVHCEIFTGYIFTLSQSYNGIKEITEITRSNNLDSICQPTQMAVSRMATLLCPKCFYKDNFFILNSCNPLIVYEMMQFYSLGILVRMSDKNSLTLLCYLMVNLGMNKLFPQLGNNLPL